MTDISHIVSDNIAESIAETVSETVSESVPKSVPETTPKTVPDYVSEYVPKTTPKTVFDYVSEYVPEYIPEYIPKSVPNFVPKSVSEPVIDSITTDITFKKTDGISGICEDKYIVSKKNKCMPVWIDTYIDHTDERYIDFRYLAEEYIKINTSDVKFLMLDDLLEFVPRDDAYYRGLTRLLWFRYMKKADRRIIHQQRR